MSNNDIINQEEKRLYEKSQNRKKKNKPKMKVSGKSVQKIQALIRKKKK